MARTPEDLTGEEINNLIDQQATPTKGKVPHAAQKQMSDIVSFLRIRGIELDVAQHLYVEACVVSAYTSGWLDCYNDTQPK